MIHLWRGMLQLSFTQLTHNRVESNCVGFCVYISIYISLHSLLTLHQLLSVDLT
jgi:hypothetical protein